MTSTVGRRAITVSVMLSSVIFALGFLVSYTAVDEAWVAANNEGLPLQADGSGSLPGLVLFILARNLSAAALLFSGAITAGAGSLLSVGLVSAYVGATAKVGVAADGAGALLGDAGPYVPFELAGCLLAASAGLYPAVAASVASLRPAAAGDAPRRSWLCAYVGSVPAALCIAAAAAALILVGAVVEALVISGR